MLCRDLLDDAEVLALRKLIQIKSEILPNIYVNGDESYLSRVLLNLLDNAVKYNVERGIISISLTDSGSSVVFRISNTGQEIPKEHQNRIFERFYRADSSRSSETFGSGLGLSICKEIIVAHSGQIWLERQAPGWTAFGFTLPKKMAPRPLSAS
jgi:two-component system phosphate regulon sensor histidine kinase PhoR